MDSLPLGQTVQTSYETVRDALPQLARAAALWLVLLLLLQAILRLWSGLGEPPVAEVTEVDGGRITSFVIELLGTLVAIAAIAVAWHRWILRREPIGEGTAPLDAAVLRYIVMTVAIALTVGLPMGAALALLAGFGGESQAVRLLAVPVVVVGALAWVRLNLVLPAAAVGDMTMTIRRSWERTRGHAFTLLLGIVMTSVPTALVALIVAVILGALVGDTPILRNLPAAVLIAGNFVETALVTSFLSLAYRRLAGGPQPVNA